MGEHGADLTSTDAGADSLTHRWHLPGGACPLLRAQAAPVRRRATARIILWTERHDRAARLSLFPSPMAVDVLTAPTRILVVDDHPVIRQGLHRLLEGEPGFSLAGEAADAGEALVLLRERDIDLVVLDLSLKGVSGLEFIKQALAEHPGLLILVLSMHHEQFYAERALRAGARGYIMKQEPPAHLVKALKRVAAGDLYLSSTFSNAFVQQAVGVSGDAPSGPERLSDREVEVLRLIGQGRRTRDIASDLSLSIKTIESYRANIKRKLSLDDASALAHYAFQWVQAQADPNAMG
jgi:DNA-binding NarL/FixJ family response regulator